MSRFYVTFCDAYTYFNNLAIINLINIKFYTGVLGELTDPKKVRSSCITMPEQLGKRERKTSYKLSAVFDNSGEGETKSPRMTRGAMAAAATTKPKGRPKGKKNENRVNNDERRYRMDDNVIENEWTYTNEDQELNEISARVQRNSSGLDDAVGKSLIVFQTIFHLLPREVLINIQSTIQEKRGDDYVWLHELVNTALTSENNNPGLMLTNPNTGNHGRDVENVPATATSPAGAPAGAGETPNIVAAATITNTNRSTMETQVNDRVRDQLESINRKKNIIISGMIEGYDDWQLIHMLYNMGLDSPLQTLF